MEPVRPLRDVFAGLADTSAGPEDAGASPPDPRSLLGEHHDLPDDLLFTAIGSYANTAPAEVAEHLAPIVTEPGADAENALGLLTSAPTGAWDGEVELPDTDEPGLLLDDEGPELDDERPELNDDLADPGLSLDHPDALDQSGDDLGTELGTDFDAGFGDHQVGDGLSDGLDDGLSDALDDGLDDGFGDGEATDLDSATAVPTHESTNSPAEHDYLGHHGDDPSTGDPTALNDPTALDALDGVDGVDDHNAAALDDFDS
jgi:hypothetical protein